MRRFVVLGVAAVAAGAFMGGTAQATHEESCIGDVTTVNGPGGKTFYIADRTQGEATINHWVYEETNGIPGLQPGGKSLLLNEDDTCKTDTLGPDGKPITPDTLYL